jgi:hypothetical protein
MDPARTHHVGLRGVAIPAYAVAVFGIALAVGARPESPAGAVSRGR